jgi:MoxR-like ATPase
MTGRFTPAIDDIKYVAKPVLRHRIVTSFKAEADRLDANAIIDKLVAELG